MTIASTSKIVGLFLWISSVIILNAQVSSAVVRFSNGDFGIDAPFYAADGTNRLVGSNYVAALFVAATNSTAFTLVSPFRQFTVVTNAGYWVPINVAVPQFPPGSRVRVQVRFWDQARLPNANFAQAEAAGAEIGIAEIPELILNPDPTPTPLFGLQSASLIPTLTLSRGGPRVAHDPANAAGGSQISHLCGVPVGTNRWFRLTSPRDAIAVLNTDGSSIDTVMAAFTGSIVNVAALMQLACNDDRSPTLTSSAFNLPLRADSLYVICVAGKHDANGPVQLNYANGVSVEIRRILPGQSIEVSWPADEGNYQLETSPGHWPSTSSAWQPIDEPPLLLDGHYVMPLPGLDSYQGFRLRAIP